GIEQMRVVEHVKITNYQTYEDKRNEFRARVMKAKAPRRLHISNYLTLLFENHLTVLYQIQEMIRAKRIVQESDILHEINTYNELLSSRNELGCTLLIEIEEAALREQKLREWWCLPEKMYVLLENGTRIFATFDERQRGDGSLSSVQYLKFSTCGRGPIAAGVDLPGFQIEVSLTAEQKQALRDDLE